MMSDTTTVDKTMVDQQTGKLVLLIAETRPWREAATMHRQLAAKVKTYVRYIRSPDFAREHGRAADDAVVRLVTKESPGEESLKYCTQVRYELSKHGISFEVRVLGGTPPVETVEGPPAGGPPSETAVPEAEESRVETGPAAVEPGEAIGTEEYEESGGFAGVQDTFEAGEYDDAEEVVGTAEPIGAHESVVAEEGVSAAEIERVSFLPEDEFRPAEPEAAKPAEPVSFVTGRQPTRTATTGRFPDLEAAAAGPPNLKGAIAAAISSAIAGGILWFLLAAVAEEPASPLALAVGVMVGFSVRVRGAGETVEFRIVGLLGTLLGCLIGSLLAAAVIVAAREGADILDLLSGVGAALSTLGRAYSIHSLGVYAIALYLGFRIAAPKKPEASAPGT